ncbi:MAG TPA: fibronectin type III domain-containing protein [Candidatus Limnocylindria bacterium]|nr:fibronectin type III domain-containing protein [Candidatus Limnocylindria bacterium]
MPTATPIAHAQPRVVRGQPLRLLLILGVALILAIPLVQVGANAELELTGDVVLEHADDFSAGRAQEQLVLESKQGRFVLAGRGASALREKTRVRVRGTRSGDTLVLADSGSVTTLSASAGFSDLTAAASGTGTKRVAVLLMNFTAPPPTPSPTPPPTPTPLPTDTPDPSASPTITPSPTPSPSPSPTPQPTPTPQPPKEPWTKSFVRGLYFTNTKSVAAYFSEVSNGRLSLTGDVFGYYTIEAKTSTCNHSDWATKARQMATASGVKLDEYDYIVHAFGRVSGCWWGGLAQVYGRYNWINGSMTPYVTMHELGHNMGAHHASTMTCTSGGSRVRLSSNCSVSEYGDPFDVMGQNASGGNLQRHLQAWHRRQVGFLHSSDQLTVTVNGHYTLATAQIAGGSPRSLRIRRNSSEFFYLEYRQPYGLFDTYSSTAAVVNGVLVRIAPDTKRSQSFLLDMNPSTSSFSDAALAVGQTFNRGGISIRTTSIGPKSARLRIQVGPDTVPPSTPGGLTATAGSNNSLTLRWSASTDDLEVTGYRVSRDGTVLASLGAGARSYTDSGLVVGVTYEYSVQALDAAGNASAPATVSWQTPDTTPPSAPTGVTATQSGPRSVSLSWNEATDDGVVVRYRVRRDGKLLNKTTGTTFTDSSVVDGFGYSYEVRAEDAAGNVGVSGKATPATIWLPDVTPPTAPGAVSLGAPGIGAASLSWSPATDNVAVTGYTVRRDGKVVATLSGGATSFTDDDLAAGTYDYSVTAFDAAGNVGPALHSSVSVSGADTQPPSAPQNLAGRARDGRYVDLTWDASTDNQPGTITYRVLRDGNRIATTTNLHFTDRPASAGTYRYKVRAVDAAGNKSSFSTIVEVRAVTSLSPSAPKKLRGQALDRRYVRLTWNASTGGSGTIRYRVIRNGVRIAVTRNLTYTDRAPSLGTHYYKLRAVDGAGRTSSFTPRISVTAVKAV